MSKFGFDQLEKKVEAVVDLFLKNDKKLKNKIIELAPLEKGAKVSVRKK
jgi:hypothetical protein